MAKKKSVRPKRTKAASRKTAKQPAARRGRKKPTAKKVGQRAAARRGAAKKTLKTQRQTAARPARRTPAKATKRPARTPPPPPQSRTRTAAAPKAAPRPKRPRRTKQAMPPQPRTIPTPVVDVQPVVPVTPAAPAAPPAPVVNPVIGSALAPTQIVGGQPPPVIRDPAAARPPPSAAMSGGPAPSPGASLKVGDTAPEFSLPDEKGELHRLAEYRGEKVVLYFYPKDDTPGCTTEACGFRDRHADFTDRDAVILGVSADDAASHQRFIQKYGLNFPLLADVNHRVAEAYGVWVQKQRAGTPYMGIARTTFVIDGNGRIAHIFRNVRPEEHEAEVLRTLATI